MKNPSRALALGLSALLLSASFPLSAAAQVGRVAVNVPTAGVSGAAGAVRIGGPALLSPSGASLSAPGLGATLAPSIAPSLSLTPSAPAASLAAPSAAPAPFAAAPAISPVGPSRVGVVSAALAAAPAANLGAPAEGVDRKTVIAGVETAVTELQGAKHAGPVASPAVLDRLFEGFERRQAANDAPSVAGAESASGAKLAPATAKTSPAADGPRWVLTGEKPAQPKSSWKRTLSTGYLGAVLSLVATAVIVGGAQLLGHELHPNYASPAEGLGAMPSLLQAGVLFAAASVLAPIAEEIVFRAGIQGGLSKVTKFLRLGGFWVPAVLGSVIFVAVHETSDPVLFAARFVGAMIFAYVYQKEGMLASMSMHAFHNGLLTAPILAAAIVGSLGLGGAAAGLLGAGISLGMLVAAVLYVVKSVRLLNRQRGDIKSGALAPKAFTTTHGLWSLVIMLAGFFLLMPNIFWLAGALGIMPWLLYKKLKG
jgi:membrane protease YdiL (CAAX protease family)